MGRKFLILLLLVLFLPPAVAADEAGFYEDDEIRIGMPSNWTAERHDDGTVTLQSPDQDDLGAGPRIIIAVIGWPWNIGTISEGTKDDFTRDFMQLYEDAVTGSLDLEYSEIRTIGNHTALEMEFTSLMGGLSHSKLLIFIIEDGDRDFMIGCSSPTGDYAANREIFEEAVRSFSIKSPHKNQWSSFLYGIGVDPVFLSIEAVLVFLSLVLLGIMFRVDEGNRRALPLKLIIAYMIYNLSSGLVYGFMIFGGFQLAGSVLGIIILYQGLWLMKRNWMHVQLVFMAAAVAIDVGLIYLTGFDPEILLYMALHAASMAWLWKNRGIFVKGGKPRVQT